MRRLPTLTASIAVVAAVAIGLGALPPTKSEGAGGAAFVSVSTSSSAFGKKFRDWSAEWWQFALSLPASENPLVDATGDKCAVGQHGEVWFLVGSFIGPVTRACSIPEGKALFFPAINLVDINLTTQTADELRAEIAPCLDAVTTLTVEVDGTPVEKLAKARVKSSVFEVTLPPGGFLPAGTYSPVVDDGFYVMLKPLALGNHTVRILAASAGCSIQPPFSQDVTYNLTVVPVSLE